MSFMGISLFGRVEGLDDIVEKIFTNLEEEYGRGNG